MLLVWWGRLCCRIIDLLQEQGWQISENTNYSADELLSTLPRRFVAGGRSILLYFQFAEFALKISIFGKGENDLCLINIQDIKKETIMGQLFKCLTFTLRRTENFDFYPKTDLLFCDIISTTLWHMESVVLMSRNK